VRWFEEAYERIRAELVPEAPAFVTLTLAPLSAKVKGEPAVELCAFDRIVDAGDGFGDANLISLNLYHGYDTILQLAGLAHSMIHHALPPEERHGKKFQAIAQRIGLEAPWPATAPNATLTHQLRGIYRDLEDALGYAPVGRWIPTPPKEKKPSAAIRLRCQCSTPRTLTLSKTALEKGAVLCGKCREAFREMTAP
jgi:predicted SprT family Zn-dependent metalloprotease